MHIIDAETLRKTS